MISAQAFNEMLGQFLDELSQTFPEVKDINKYKRKFEAAKKANVRLPVETFMSEASQYSDMISSKDVEVFFKPKGYAETLGITRNMWNECSSNTHNAIWQYLQSLVMLGQAIVNIPTNTMSAIENVAELCAQDIKESGKQPDMGTILGAVQKNAHLLQDVLGMVPGPSNTGRLEEDS